MKEAKKTIAQKDEEMRQLEERLQRLEMRHERSLRQRRHHHRYDSRSSQNYGEFDEETEWGGTTIMKIGAKMRQSLISICKIT